MKNQMNPCGARKWYAPVFKIAFVLCIAMMLSAPLTAYAAPQYRFGAGEGRTDSVNANDYHTAAWERFLFNYYITSGMDYRFELGRPTTFLSVVPIDVYSVNIRRDANASFQPPSYGIFSGFIPTNQVNIFFPQSVNPALWKAWELENPNVIPVFDTQHLGVNAPTVGNPVNLQNVGGGGFLPPTSISGS
jgi:hypothetical protein